jgi:hypothetical protein
VVKNLVLNVFNADRVELLLLGLLNKVDVVLFKSLWKWLVVLVLKGVVGVLDGDDLVVSHQTGEVIVS